MIKIHLNELPQYTTLVRINPQIREIIIKARKKAGSRDKLNKLITNYNPLRPIGKQYVNTLLNPKRKNIRLWALLLIYKLTNENKLLKTITLQIQKCEAGTPVKIRFPIVITPSFDGVVGHLLGDGSFGTGNENTASYKQKNELARSAFVKKLKTTFGEFKVNIKQSEKYCKIIIPKIIIDLILTKYTFKNTKTLFRRVPNKILIGKKENKIAFLAAFILDEGHIGDEIEIYSGNKLLLEDVFKITKSLNYKISSIKEKKGHNSSNNYYRFRIKPAGCKKLYLDLLKTYPRDKYFGLANKARALKFIIRKRINKQSNGKTKRKILQLLKTNSTIQDLKYKTNLHASTIREHLRDLLAKNLIKKIDREQNRIIWSAI